MFHYHKFSFCKWYNCACVCALQCVVTHINKLLISSPWVHCFLTSFLNNLNVFSKMSFLKVFSKCLYLASALLCDLSYCLLFAKDSGLIVLVLRLSWYSLNWLTIFRLSTRVNNQTSENYSEISYLKYMTLIIICKSN